MNLYEYFMNQADSLTSTDAKGVDLKRERERERVRSEVQVSCDSDVFEKERGVFRKSSNLALA